MPRFSIVKGKSPLHPSALRLKDIKPGRCITLVNCQYGARSDYIVMGYPFVEHDEVLNTSEIMIPLRSVRSGVTYNFTAWEIGIVSSRYGWHEYYFTIDHRKRRLLPEPRSLSESRTSYVAGYSSSAAAFHEWRPSPVGS